MLDLVGKDLGRYHILERLGEGGMATVYKAFDTRLERQVAIKVIRADVGQGTEMLKRFEREAKALAQLTHPNIVHINDYGEQGGVPYVVMDFLPGGTLKQKLGQPMPYAEAARLLAPIARALEYAHQLKIIHRDVKPANILLTQSSAPMLSDFGIAKILEGRATTELTATGAGIGTPDYMAPEQWMGKAEARTDIYALGIVFYELITGRRPYTADTPAAILLKHVNDPLPSPRLFVRDLPYQVEQVINKALAKNIDDRFQSMTEFAQRLEQLAAGRGVTATQTQAVGGGPTQLVQPGTGPTGRPLVTPPPPYSRGPVTPPPPYSRAPVTPPPPSRPNPTGPYPATGGYQSTGGYPPTGAYPGTGPHPATGPYPATGGWTSGGNGAGAIPGAGTRQLTWLVVGLGALLVLCLVGGVAGGIYAYGRYNFGGSSPTATVAALATEPPPGVTSVVAAEPTKTPPSSQASTNTPPGPSVPTAVPITPIATASANNTGLTGIAFSPDGQLLASASEDNNLDLWKWDGTSIQHLSELTGHSRPVTSVAFSPDGSTLASGSEDNTVRVWALQNSSLLQTLQGSQGHTAAVRSVAFSPDSRFVASGSDDGTVKLWNASTGDLVSTFRDASAAPGEQVLAVAFSPDGQTLAAAGTVTRLWSVGGATDKPVHILKVQANGAAFSPDGRTLVTSGDTPQLWDTASGQSQRSFNDAQGSVGVAFNPDGQHIAAGNKNKSAYAWTATGDAHPLFAFVGSQANENAVAFSPDGRFLAGASSDKIVRVWKLQDNAVPTFTPWPATDTPTPIPPTRTRVPPTRTRVPPTWTPVPPTWTPVPPTLPPTVPPTDTPTPHLAITFRPILTQIIIKPPILLLPSDTPTPIPIIIRPILTAPVIIRP